MDTRSVATSGAVPSLAPVPTAIIPKRQGLGHGEKVRKRITHTPAHFDRELEESTDGKSRAIRAGERLQQKLGGTGHRIQPRGELRRQRRRRLRCEHGTYAALRAERERGLRFRRHECRRVAYHGEDVASFALWLRRRANGSAEPVQPFADTLLHGR